MKPSDFSAPVSPDVHNGGGGGYCGTDVDTTTFYGASNEDSEFLAPALRRGSITSKEQKDDGSRNDFIIGDEQLDQYSEQQDALSCNSVQHAVEQLASYKDLFSWQEQHEHLLNQQSEQQAVRPCRPVMQVVEQLVSCKDPNSIDPWADYDIDGKLVMNHAM